MITTTLKAEGATLVYHRDFLPEKVSTALLGHLIATVPWRQDQIRVYGKTHDLPRLQQWYGDSGTTYTWSGIKMDPLPWSPELEDVRTKIEALTGWRANSVLLNYYRNGKDTVGWHADDEPELGTDPTIVSLSLGADRDFLLRPKGDRSGEKIKISLEDGSLLVMSGETQTNWEHCLPRRSFAGERVNATFRLRRV